MAEKKRIAAIVGGGLAGLAAAVRLHDLTKNQPDSAPEIHLFESGKHLGGRASSHFFAGENALLDGAQHVTMNCCPAMLQFLERTDLRQFWSLQEEMTFCVRHPVRSALNFVSKSSQKSGSADSPLQFYGFRNSPWLPRPFQLLPSLWGLKFLTRLERFQLLGILRRIQHSTPAPGLPFRDWLEDLFCPDRVAELFFEPVILSAFSDQAENVSAGIAQSIFQQMLLGPRDAWHLWLPRKPLREIFDAELTPTLERLGIRIHRQTPVQRVFPGRLAIRDSRTGADSDFRADSIILTVPWFRAGTLLPELVTRNTFNPDVYEPRTITAVHFWADRELFPQPNLVFPRETIQWLFRPSFPVSASQPGVYHQALLSDSDRCVSTDPEALERLVRAELMMLFPESRILHLRVSRTPAAVFSCNAWMEHSRPGALTPFQSIFLAGDWTETGLPATMESAVRSGNRAAEEAAFEISDST